MTRRLPALLAAIALLLPLSACGGDGDSVVSDKSPEEVLAVAKEKLDSTESVRIELSTGSTPSEGNGVLSAKGVLTQAPAFEGEVEVFLSGLQASVPVVAIDDRLYAKLPLTTKFAVIDPTEYGAPNPADFIDPDSGLSSLLSELQDVEKESDKRAGDKILSTYSGTLSGDKVAPIIPSADADSTYETEIGIDQDGFITSLEATGAFFPGDDDVTYRMTFADYGKSVTITKP